jgi:hypothetical protein
MKKLLFVLLLCLFGLSLYSEGESIAIGREYINPELCVYPDGFC